MDCIKAKQICRNFFRLLPLQYHLTASVHSVFAHAVNIQTEFGLCTLLCNNSLRPYSVVLGNAADFEGWGFNKGACLFLRADKIWSNTTPLISLKNAKSVNLKMPKNLRPIDRFAQKLDILAQSVYHSGRHQGLAPLLSSASFPIDENHYSLFLRPRIAGFCLAMRGNNLENIRSCTAQIAGCGPGLTPSADDFICGFLSVWAACETLAGGGKLAEKKIKTAAAEAEKHTTSVSASFLRHCAEGLYPLDTLAFVRALFGKCDLQAFPRLCEKIIQSGSSSGADYLCGAYYALLEHSTNQVEVKKEK